jgi:uracil-DNA glycosylase
VTYLPQAYGADCANCPIGPNGPLRDPSKPWIPVGPEWHHDASVIAVAENPADDEVREGRPLVGRSGTQEWNPALASIGRKRTDVTLTNTISCQPPGEASGAYKRMERALKTENDRLREEAVLTGAGPHQWPSPASCCAPRLRWELGHYRNVIALGGTAAKAILHTTQGIHAIAGGPVELPSGHKVLPTFHPAYILRAPQDREMWHADLAKAFRFFEGKRNWVEPYYVWKPSVAELEAWLAEPARFWAYDYETDHKDPMRAKVDCVGFGTVVDDPREVVCEKCLGSGRRRTMFDPGDGWVAAPADQRHLACPCCEGVGRRRVTTRMCVVPIRSVENERRPFYSPPEEAAIKDVLRRFFTDPTKWKIAHNGYAYDEFVTHHWLGVSTWPRRDTLPIARAVAPNRKKSLGIVGRIYCDVQSWKADSEGKKIANNAKRDGQLGYYNGTDAVVTAVIHDPLVKGAETRGYFRPLAESLRPRHWPARLPWTLEGVDTARSEMCQEMRYAGMWVDQEARARHIRQLDTDIERYRALAVAYAEGLGITGPVIGKGNPRVTCANCARNCSRRPNGRPWFHRRTDGTPCPGCTVAGTPASGHEPFNPASDRQLGQVFFGAWGIVPTKFSEETSQPSCDDEVMRDILCSPDLLVDRETFVDAVRRFKRAQKAKSTFLKPLAPRAGWVPRYKIGKDGKVSGKPLNDEPLVAEDGRVRPFITAIITSVARLNSSAINSQNYPGKYRNVIAAQPVYPRDDPRWPGRVLMSGDVDQFHLRIIANRWGISRLLQGFHDGLDPHCMLAYDFFGAKFRHASGWGPSGFSLKQSDKPKKDSDASKMREISKVIRYQGAYADVPEGIFVSVRKTENKETGDMPFKDFTLREVRRLYRVWMRAEPEWETAWERVMAQYRRNGGWIEEAVLGRRSGGLEDGKKQAVVNYDILVCEPAIMALIETEIRAAFPCGHDGPGTGLIAQVHDSITIETEGFAWVEDRDGKKFVVCDEATERKRLRMHECMNGVRIPGWVVPITAEIGVGPVRDAQGKPQLSNWKAA